MESMGKQPVNTPEIITLHPKTARLLAVEVLLAEPEALGDDVLESCLYILRDRLQGKGIEDDLVTPSLPYQPRR
jgi:hypothetical protein